MKDLITRIWNNDESLTRLDLSTREDDISYSVRNSTTAEETLSQCAKHSLIDAASKNNRLSHLRLFSSYLDSVRGPGLFTAHLDMIQHLKGLRDLQIHGYCVPPLAFPTRQLAKVIHRKYGGERLKDPSHDRKPRRKSLQRLALHQVRMDPHDRTGQILLARAFASLQQQPEEPSSCTLHDLEWNPFPFTAATSMALPSDEDQRTDGGTLIVAAIANLPLKRLALTGGCTSSTTMTRLGLSSPAFAPMFRITKGINGRNAHHHLQALQLSSWILDNADCKVLARFLKQTQTDDLTELDLSGCIFYWTNNNRNDSSEQPQRSDDDSPLAIMKAFETNTSVQYLNMTNCQFHVVPVNNASSYNENSTGTVATMEERVYTTLTRAVESHNHTLSWVKTCPLLQQRAKQEWKNVKTSTNGNTSDKISVLDVLDDLLVLNRSALLSSTSNSASPSCIRKSLTAGPHRETWSHIVQRTSSSPTALYAMLRGNVDQLFCTESPTATTRCEWL